VSKHLPRYTKAITCRYSRYGTQHSAASNAPATMRPSVSFRSSIRTYRERVRWSFGTAIERRLLATTVTNRHCLQRTAIEPANSRYTSTTPGADRQHATD